MEKKLTIEQITSQGIIFNNEYHTKRVEESESVANEVRKFHTCDVLHMVNNHDEKYYLEYSEIILQSDPLKIVISYDDYRKKYVIRGNYELYKFSTYELSEIFKKFEEPKQIGVLTSKKILDWITYHINVSNEMEIVNKSKESNLEFRINEFTEQTKGLDVVYQNVNKTKGYIIRGGLRLIFEIGDSYTSTRIEVDAKTNIENFINISDNKLRG